MKILMVLSLHDKPGMFFWYTILAPAGMPRDVSSRINADMKRALKPE